MNAQHSEVYKIICYDLLARLVLLQTRRKVAKNLLFSAKVACFLAIFDENSKFLVTLRRLCVGSRRARRA